MSFLSNSCFKKQAECYNVSNFVLSKISPFHKIKNEPTDGCWQQPTGISPLHSSCSPTHCLRRSERSDFDGKGVSACLYVMARKQPRLHCGVVEIAPLFREKHRGAPAVRLDTDSNVSVCPMMHHHCPAGIFFKVLSRNVERVRPFRLWSQ